MTQNSTHNIEIEYRVLNNISVTFMLNIKNSIPSHTWQIGTYLRLANLITKYLKLLGFKYLITLRKKSSGSKY